MCWTDSQSPLVLQASDPIAVGLGTVACGRVFSQPQQANPNSARRRGLPEKRVAAIQLEAKRIDAVNEAAESRERAN